jgi:hypothetical protein
MGEKKCNKCDEVKPFSDFNKDKSRKDGYHSICRLCKQIYYEENKKKIKEKNRKYYQDNKEKLKEWQKKYTKENIEYIQERNRENYHDNKEYYNEKSKKYYQDNKEKIEEYQKKYRKENLDYIKERDREYYESNKEKIKNRKKRWREENRDEILGKKRLWYKENKDRVNKERVIKRKIKPLEDPTYSLKRNLNSIVRRAFLRNGYTKDSKTYEIIGCDFECLTHHFENQFEEWMTWENRGLYNGELCYGWDIDHIIPMSTAKTKEDVIRLSHYSNLQPLCGYTNRHIKRDNHFTDSTIEPFLL